MNFKYCLQFSIINDKANPLSDKDGDILSMNFPYPVTFWAKEDISLFITPDTSGETVKRFLSKVLSWLEREENLLKRAKEGIGKELIKANKENEAKVLKATKEFMDSIDLQRETES